MRRAIGLLALGAVFVLAGCGGGGKARSTGTETTASTTTAASQSSRPKAPKVKPAAGAAAKRYDRAMQELGGQLSTFFGQVGREDENATESQAIANMHSVQDHLRRAAAQLAKMAVPAKVAADQRKLIAAVLEYANELDGVIVQLKKGNLAELSFIPQLKGIQDMGKATALISAAGYNITG